MKYIKYINKLNADLTGKVFVVTGANSGIGYELSKYLMFLNAKVIMACRNKQKAEKAFQEIIKEIPNAKAEIMIYDQSSFESIKKFSDELKNKYQCIDGIVFNAGIYFPKKGMKSKDDLELTLATNYFGQYYLLNNLKEYLHKNNARLVIVTSLTATLSKNIGLDKYQTCSRNKLYGYSKFLLSSEAFYLNKEENPNVFLVHPGVCSTNILFNKDTGLSSAFARAGRRFLNLFTHSAEKAALCSLLGCILPYKKNIYIKPRGLFAISGYPCIKRIPKRFDHAEIISQTEEIISLRGKIDVTC